MSKVTLIVADTLQRSGLEAIFEEFFPEIEVISASTNQFITTTGDNGIYITDSYTYVSEQDFFLTRRNRTIVLCHSVRSDIDTNAGRTPYMLNSRVDREQIVDEISNFVSKNGSATGADNGTIGIGEELSGREIQVLTLIVKGAINKEIASELGISLNTVLTHRKNITAKLGIKTVSGLTLYALMHGYISGEINE